MFLYTQYSLIVLVRCEFRFLAGQVVEEVLHWSRNAMEVRRLCARKEEMFRELRGSITPAIPPGTMTLLEVLERNNVRASFRAHHSYRLLTITEWLAPFVHACHFEPSASLGSQYDCDGIACSMTH